MMLTKQSLDFVPKVGPRPRRKSGPDHVGTDRVGSRAASPVSSALAMARILLFGTSATN